MTRARYVCLGLLFAWILQAISASAQIRVTPLSPQTLDFMSLDAATSTVVTGQPYSADGVTKITQTLADGTRIQREVRSKFYRDSAGRVRREQNILGLDSLLGPLSSEPQTAITIIDPATGTVSTLDPAGQQGRSWIILRDGYRVSVPSSSPSIITLQPAPAVPTPAPKTESLGTRQIEGLSATGEKSSSIIPAGRIGNDRPIEILDERWISTDLKVVLLARHRDPHTGEVEFRLTNIKRAEPSPDLFKIPSNSFIMKSPPQPPTPAPAASPATPQNPRSPGPVPAPR